MADGRTGFQAIEHLRSALGAPIPAFLMSGDTAPERLREATASGYHLLHKPIGPATLRATLNHFLRDHMQSQRSVQKRSLQMRRLTRPLQVPAESCGRNDRLGAVRDVQRLEDSSDVVSNCRLGQVEHTSDGLVALPLHHQG